MKYVWGCRTDKRCAAPGFLYTAKRRDSLSCTAKWEESRIPLHSHCGNPENIQQNRENLESRCIFIAEILKTDSEIRKNPNPAVFAAALATKQGCAFAETCFTYCDTSFLRGLFNAQKRLSYSGGRLTSEYGSL